MDKQTAMNRLNLLVLHCHLCGKELQTYRAVPSKIWDTPSQEVQIAIEHQTRKGSSTGNESKNQPPITPPFEGTAATVIQQSPQRLTQTPTPKDIDCFCFNCIADKKVPVSSLHNQTFHDLALRFIDFIPLPQYELSQRCLQLNEQIQARSSEILHRIEEQLENMKFFLLKLGSETRKVCQSYIKAIKQYEGMGWMEIVRNMVNGKHKTFNQVDCLESLKKKMGELAKIRAKVDQVSISIPEFADVFVLENRKKIKICDLPISSMINLRGRTYYGAADGRIIYESFQNMPLPQPSQPAQNTPSQLQLPSTYLKSLKCHESLIRSFAHNSQYTLFSGSDDFTIKAWSTFGGQLTLLHTFGILEEHKSYHRNICVVGNGKRLVSTRGQYDSYRVRVWGNVDEHQNEQRQNVKSQQKESKQQANEYVGIGCLEAHTSFIRAMIVVDRNKDLIMTGSDDQRVCLWDGRNMRLLQVLKRQRKVSNIIVNQDDNLLAILEQDNRIYILDMANMQCISMWQFPRKVLSSIGWSSAKRPMSHSLHSLCNIYYPNSDLILISMPISLSIWNWCGDKIWCYDIETSYTPTSMMQIGQTIVVSDGTGRIDEFIVDLK